MYRIDDVTAAPTLPAVPTDNIGSPGYFTGGNPPTTAATRVRFWWLNLVQESLIALLTATGLTPSKSNSGLVLQAIQILCFKSARYTTLQAFAASTSWTVPAGVFFAKTWVTGGGGGGGAGNPQPYGGGGGGAGGTAYQILAVTPGQVIQITVGAGGTAGVYNASNSNIGAAGAGQTTSFGTYLSATGGFGGASGAPFAFGGSPGSGAGQAFQVSGGWGGDGNASGAFFPGNGGASFWGGGGRAGTAGGWPGLAYGAGGGAGYTTASNGGAGAPGICLVEY